MKPTISPLFYRACDAIRWAANQGWKSEEFDIDGDTEMSHYYAVKINP
jgi:hypothetical protein